MKKFKFPALALLVALANVSFASCSNDDKNEPTPGVPKPSVEKRLTQVKRVGHTYDFQYNSDGRISKVVIKYNNQTDRTIDYTYSPSQISVTETYSGGGSDTEIYSLNNGLISKLQGETEYSYDEGRISKWRENTGSNKTFEWNMGEIIKTATKWSDEPTTYRATYGYSDRYDYGRIVGIVVESNDMLYDDFDPYLVMQGFFGITPIHLPQDASDGYGNNYAWSYEFDTDGYPSSVTEHMNGRNLSSITFIWEAI